jgi:hypothetical protein
VANGILQPLPRKGIAAGIDDEPAGRRAQVEKIPVPDSPQVGFPDEKCSFALAGGDARYTHASFDFVKRQLGIALYRVVPAAYDEYASCTRRVPEFGTFTSSVRSTFRDHHLIVEIYKFSLPALSIQEAGPPRQ